MASVALIQNKVELLEDLRVNGDIISNSNTPYARPLTKAFTLPMYTYQAPNSTYYNKWVRLGRFTRTTDPEFVCEIIRQGDFNYSNLMIHTRINAHIWTASAANLNISITNLTPLGSHPGWAIDSNRNLYYHDTMLWTQRGYLLVMSMDGFEIDIGTGDIHNTSLTFRYLTGSTYSWEGVY